MNVSGSAIKGSATFLDSHRNHSPVSAKTRRSIARRKFHPSLPLHLDAVRFLQPFADGQIFPFHSSQHLRNKRCAFLHLPNCGPPAATTIAILVGDYRKYLLGISPRRNMYWTVFPFETILSSNHRLGVFVFRGVRAVHDPRSNSKNVEGLRA